MNPDNNSFEDTVIEKEIDDSEHAVVIEDNDKKKYISRTIIKILIGAIILAVVAPIIIDSVIGPDPILEDNMAVSSTSDYGNSAGSGLFMLGEIAINGVGNVLSVFSWFSFVGPIIFLIAFAVIVLALVLLIEKIPSFNIYLKTFVILSFVFLLGLRIIHLGYMYGILAKTGSNVVYMNRTYKYRDLIEYNGYYYFDYNDYIKRVRKNGFIVNTLGQVDGENLTYLAFLYKDNIYIVDVSFKQYFKFNINTNEIKAIKREGDFIEDSRKDNIIYFYNEKTIKKERTFDQTQFTLYKIDLNTDEILETIYLEKGTIKNISELFDDEYNLIDSKVEEYRIKDDE